MIKHTIAVLVENHFGVLARVSGLFSARGFNIDSLAVGETQDPEVSRMTIVAHGDDRVVNQIMKQLDRLVDVIKIENLTSSEMIDRELVLAKIFAPADKRAELMQIVNTFRAKVVDVNHASITIEVTGGESKIDAMLELLKPFGLEEVVRTGLIAMARRGKLEAPSKAVSKPAAVKKGVAKKKSSKKKS